MKEKEFAIELPQGGILSNPQFQKGFDGEEFLQFVGWNLNGKTIHVDSIKVKKGDQVYLVAKLREVK